MDNLQRIQEITKHALKRHDGRDSEMQHNLHKLTAKERILFLLDEGSFVEIGSLINGTGDGVITGYGTIQGRLIFIASQDYTINGGAVTIGNSKKVVNIMDMAGKMGAPIIQIFDSVGVKLNENLNVLMEYGNVLNKNAQLSGVVPRIAVVSGPCVGVSALNCTMSDFTIIVDDIGELAMKASNALIEKEQKYVDKNMYSNSDINSKNGNIQINAKNEKEALANVKKIMAFIPSNNLEKAPFGKEALDLNVVNKKFNQMVEDNDVNVREIIMELADTESLVEINEEWEKAIVTSLVKINGLTIGIIGNDSEIKSEIDSKIADKISRFVKMCDCFNIPILSIVDNTGFITSLEEEQNGLALYCSKIISSLANARIPKVSLIVGKAYGAGYLALASKQASFDLSLAWPSAKISLTEPKTLIKISYKDEINALENPRNEEENIINKYMDEVTDPFKAAEKGIIDEIIVPSETKARIFSAFDMLYSKRELRYPKKHDTSLI